MKGFSRRKLESNWDRYKESEKQEVDDDMPTRRGADYHVLLESAGELRPPEARFLCHFFLEIACEDSGQPPKCVCKNTAHFVINGKNSQDLKGLMFFT